MADTLIVDGTFYPAYQKKRQDFGPDTFACAENTVTKLIATQTTGEHPGMLLGKVQSGKTRTFISIIALAFDNGYNVAIVLSKNSKALIEQTMIRLKDEFREFIEEGDLSIYDIMQSPTKFTKSELQSKMLFVAKKQDDNLKRLLSLFNETCPDMKTHRVLIIDDEADNASIGYTKKGDIINANKIATKISDLRSVINSVSFLQVTATPYSLYLQPDEVEVDNVFSFKPTRPAFTVLVPVPPEYVGGDTYFGAQARSDVPTVENFIHCNVDHQEFERLKKPDRRAFKLEECLTTPAIKGCRSAFISFLVGGTILRANGLEQGKKLGKLRYSFLLHTEAGKNSHAWQKQITEELRDKLRDAINDDPTLFESLIRTEIADLKSSLELASHTIPGETIILEGVKHALLDDQISILIANSNNDVATMLDHNGQLKLSNPFNWFIGGQVIDRGVTLANLIGFYYGRRPQKYQQDTVLQHSRMYGYRRAELPLTRFYTSALIRNAMFQMEDFDSSLRATIEGGGDKAVQFIRKAADGKIVPCSPNKILVSTTQTIKPFKRILPIGFQTGYRTGSDGIAGNIKKIDDIVNDLGGFNPDYPIMTTLGRAIEILDLIQPTLHAVEDEDSPIFDWDMAKAALIHLSMQHPDPAEHSKVWIWAARDRNSSRFASIGSHAKFIETPDSEKTEGVLAKRHAINHPILFLLRQKGEKGKGWRDAEFYWPVIRGQQNTPTSVYVADTISDSDS